MPTILTTSPAAARGRAAAVRDERTAVRELSARAADEAVPELERERCAQMAEQLRASLKNEPPPAELAGGGSADVRSKHDRNDGNRVRRRLRGYRDTPTVFAPVAATIGEQLAQLGDRVERLYVTGGRPGGSSAGMLAWGLGELPAGWAHHAGGHYTETDFPCYRYRNPAGATLEVHRAAGWFGERATWPAAETCAQAWELLRDGLERGFDHGQLRSTPSATGRNLWLRTIPFQHDGWAPCSVDVQQLIRSTAGQGRLQLVMPGGTPLPAGLVEYDARFAYAALCWGLPAGEPTRDRVNEYAGQQRGRYRCTWTVPAGWQHPGLLAGRGERYVDEPGATGSGWVDGAELGVALNAGWPVTIHERLLFPRYRGRGPLDTWADKLVKLRERVTADVDAGRVEPEAGQLVCDALRAVLLQGVGAFASRPRVVTRCSADIADVPAGAVNRRFDRGARLHVWGEPAPASRYAAEMAHPEWTAAIWARARARLLDAPTGIPGVRTGALHTEPGTVIAFRTDALYLSADPGWQQLDDGRPGRYRLKHVWPGPMVSPADHAELLAWKVAGHGA